MTINRKKPHERYKFVDEDGDPITVFEEEYDEGRRLEVSECILDSICEYYVHIHCFGTLHP